MPPAPAEAEQVGEHPYARSLGDLKRLHANPASRSRRRFGSAYADNLLRVAAVLAGLGLFPVALSLLSQQIAIGARAVAVGDLGLAATTALLDLCWRRRHRRSAL